ncbi:hypothetical protein ECC1470_19330, partial [Escherichia coli ECC-1470]
EFKPFRFQQLFGFGKVDGFNFGSFRGCRYWCDCRAIYLQED